MGSTSRGEAISRRGRRRNVLIAAAAVVVSLSWIAVGAGAATDARVAGSFDVTAKILKGDGAGTKVHRSYRFEPLCKSGVCNKVKLYREASTGAIIKSILARKARGVYKGKKSTRFVCSKSSTKATTTETHRMKVVRAKNGRAVKLTGRSTYRSKGGGCNSIQKNRWVGKR